MQETRLRSEERLKKIANARMGAGGVLERVRYGWSQYGGSREHPIGTMEFMTRSEGQERSGLPGPIPGTIQKFQPYACTCLSHLSMCQSTQSKREAADVIVNSS